MEQINLPGFSKPYSVLSYPNPEAAPLSYPDICWGNKAVRIVFLPCLLALAWADPLHSRWTHPFSGSEERG